VSGEPLGALRIPGPDSVLIDEARYLGLPRTPEGVVDLTGGTVRWPASWFDAPLESLDFDPLCHLAHYLPQHLETRAPLRRVVRRFLARHLPRRVGLGVEAGCSVAPDVRALRARCEAVVAFDANPVPVRAAARLFAGEPVALPRRVEGHRFEIEGVPLRVRPLAGVTWLLGNAADPPLRPGAAEVVLAVNLLDSVSDPAGLLRQLDAILAPGGLLVLTSPFHWQDGITPVDAQLAGGCGDPDYAEGSAQWLRRALGDLAYQVLETAEVPWTLVDHTRCKFHYRVHAVAARKSGG
jgi:SAM-dependent methyltransferase